METNPITTLGIDRSVLESAVPATLSKNDHIYNSLQPHIEAVAEECCTHLLGETISGRVGAGQHDALRKDVAWLACMEAFVENVRSLDVVLTSTGFGVVSTQDTAPASTYRVDALVEQVERQRLLLHDKVLDRLVGMDGWDVWGENIYVTFYKFRHLIRFAAQREPTPDDWWSAQPAIQGADILFRQLLGHAQMDALLEHIATATTTKEEEAALLTMRRLTGGHILGGGKGHMAMHQLLDYVERHLDAFPQYAESEEYEARHYEGYENSKESPLYIFQG